MKIIPYRQTLSHGCLVSDFLMLLQLKCGITYTSKDERALLLKGMDRKHSFYVVGVPKEVNKRFKEKINVIVDSGYLTKILSSLFNDTKNFEIKQRKVTTRLIRELVNHSPVICHIDNRQLGDYSHSSHFVIVEDFTDKGFKIIDSLTGKRRRLSENKLAESIESLKKNVRMCPLVYYL